MSEDEHVRTKEDLETRRDPVSPGNGPEVLIRPDERAGSEQKDPETVPVDDNERPWRRGIALSYRHKSVLAVPVEIQTAKLPRWRPRSVGDACQSRLGREPFSRAKVSELSSRGIRIDYRNADACVVAKVEGSLVQRISV